MTLVPGSNLLRMAMRIIASQPFDYYAWTKRTNQLNGQWIAAYANAVPMRGSVQSVPRDLFERMGLDFQKNYKIFYVQANFIDITRDVSGDQFVYAGVRYQALSKTDWFAQDGWIGMLAVQIPTPG